MSSSKAHPARHPHAGHLSRSERDETAARQVNGIPWGGIKCQAQSERPKRDPRRSVQASKVAANRQARTRALLGLKRRARPNGQVKTAAGVGTNLSNRWGWSSYACHNGLNRWTDTRKNNAREVVHAMPTEREIEDAKTPNGGWSKAKLAEWGVSWPPPKGWKRAIIEATKSETTA